MPPRVVGRRSNRVSGRDAPEVSSSPSLPSLQKPNLPKLQGTPSARRQYTYGSSAEPLPSRLGQRIQASQAVDLGAAVGNALSQQEQMPPPPRPAEIEDSDQDELAGGAVETPIKSRRVGMKSPILSLNPIITFTGLRQTQPRRSTRASSAALSETRSEISNDSYDQRYFAPIGDGNGDARSFATESDVFGDATIASTPRAPLAAVETSQRSSTRQPQPKRNMRRDQGDNRSETSDELASTVATSNLPSDQSQRAEISKATKTRSQPRRQTRQSQVNGSEDEQSENEQSKDEQSEDEKSEDEQPEDETPVAQKVPKHGRSANTPLPSRQKKSKTLTGSESGLPKGQPQRTEVEVSEEPQEKQTTERVNGRAAAGTSAHSAEVPREGLFERAKAGHSLLARQPLLRAGRRNQGPMLWSADSRAQAAEQSEDAPARTQPRYTWIKALSPMRSVQENLSSSDGSEEIEGSTISATGGWLWALNPLTYTNFLFRFMDIITDRVQGLGSRMWDYAQQPGNGGSAFKGLWYTLLGILVLALAAWIPWNSFLHTDLLTPRNGGPSLELSPSWGLANIMQQIGDHMPALPLLGGRHSTLEDLWELNDDGQQSVEEFLKRYEHEFNMLKRAGKLHDASIAKLEKIVPTVVHMELRNGKPVIAQEFWHAVRDLISADQTFLTVEKRGKTYDFRPEEHWKAVASRLVRDPTFTSELNMSLAGIENQLDKKMSTFWDRWVKQNDHKISVALGEALEKLKSVEPGRELDNRLNKLLKEQLKEQLSDKASSGTVVTRDEFLRHVKNEFAAHRSEIRAELNDIQPKLERLIRETVELANAGQPTTQSGMTREDITTLVNGLVRKGLADVNLEAMARGKIHAHWDLELKNQINYFSMGAGAIVDAKYSSHTYDPLGLGVIDDKAYAKGIRGAQPLPPSAALMPWDDEGDCWCAARELNRRGNPHGASLSVLLGHHIVPQHVVLEHILPGATIDPGARPLDIEVHALVADHAIRERVRDFAATHFPEVGSDIDWNAQPADLPQLFVKIGQFRYEGAELHDGVHVHRLSSELLDLRAETDQVIIRATSNYGGENHTCFYRVRLFGSRLGIDV